MSYSENEILKLTVQEAVEALLMSQSSVYSWIERDGSAEWPLILEENTITPFLMPGETMETWYTIRANNSQTLTVSCGGSFFIPSTAVFRKDFKPKGLFCKKETIEKRSFVWKKQKLL